MRSVLIVVLFVWLMLPAGAGAQEQLAQLERGPRFMQPASGGGAPVEVDVTRVAMLRRRVSLNHEGATVRQLLQEISRQSGLQFAYEPDVLELERQVGLRADSITIAAALTEILVDAGVDVLLKSPRQAVLLRRVPVQGGAIVGRVLDGKTQVALAGATVVAQGTPHSATTGNDGRYRIADVAPGTYTLRARYIGYAPGTASVSVNVDQEATADFSLEKSVQRLDEVVTTGTVVPTEVKALPTPIAVISGADIERKGYQRIDQIFRGDMPGAIAWDNGANGSYFADINVRGTSSLFVGGGNLKTYVDGVEVANQLFLSTIDPSTIERVEVLRGPQGTTVYGSQALDGVMQIFTKKGESGSGPHIEAKASAGVVESPWGNTGQTDNSLAVTGGNPDFTYRLGGGYTRHGQWAPEFTEQNASLDGGVHGKQGPLTVDLSGRYYDRTYGLPLDPRLRDAGYVNWSKPLDQTGIVRQQTYGITLGYLATPGWFHEVRLGYDRTGYESFFNRPRFTTPADSFLQVSNYDYGKASMAYHTTYSTHIGPAVQSSLTAGADHWSFNQGGFFATATTSTSNGIPTPDAGLRYEYRNTGFFAQEQIGLWDAVFLTAGLRGEKNQNFGGDYGLAWAPRVGASFVHSFRDVTAKFRIAWGRGIRPPFAGAALGSVTAFAIQLPNPNLGPEQQVGPDAGVELYFGNRASLEATYYHQTAIDLVDYVLVDGTSVPPIYQYQNVGRIRNTGWEFQGRVSAGRLSLTGTYSITTSRVQELSATYSGDLQPGDLLLRIPQHTAGATLTYDLHRTAFALGMTYIGSWTNYDVLAFDTVLYGGAPFRGSTRDYWIKYPGFAKLHMSVTQVLTNRLSMFLQSDNLTNNHSFESDNSTLNAGRSTLLGVRTRL